MKTAFIDFMDRAEQIYWCRLLYSVIYCYEFFLVSLYNLQKNL